MSPEFVFMDENVRFPYANIVNECLQSEFIIPTELPVFSPGLNPTQNVGQMLGKQNPVLQPHPTCVPELRRALLVPGSAAATKACRRTHSSGNSSLLMF
ncbi:transposable element Tcb2 transposase [Trichonephila clavipes]|nr:transposable element Tcb2 transposase [Trichonephila clavipes]